MGSSLASTLPSTDHVDDKLTKKQIRKLNASTTTIAQNSSLCAFTYHYNMAQIIKDQHIPNNA